MELISVIVPVYNTEKYIRECLDSLLNQTYKYLQVIIVNDGSVDQSANIIEEYSNKFTDFISVYQKNKGLSGARNTGLSYATGHYVTFLDSDDYLERNAIEVQYHAMKRYQSDIVYVKLRRFKGNIIKTRQLAYNFRFKYCNSREALRIYFKTFEGNVCGGLFKRRLLVDVEFPPKLIYEDNVVKTKLLYKARSIVFLDAPLYYYRYTYNSITNQKFTEKRFDLLRIGEMIEKYLLENDRANFTYYSQNYYSAITNMIYHIIGLSFKTKNFNYKEALKGINRSYFLKIIFYGLKYDFQNRIDVFLKSIKIIFYF